MQTRLLSRVLLALGVADLAVLNLVLVPRFAAKEAEASPVPPITTRISEYRAGGTLARDAADIVTHKAPVSAPGRHAFREPTAAAPDISFEFGTTRFSIARTYADLLRVVNELRADPAKHLVVRGHSDRLGLPRQNYELGRRRAEAVLASLTVIGAPKGRVTVESAGDLEPADPNETPIGWAHNRRVQLLWR